MHQYMGSHNNKIGATIGFLSFSLAFLLFFYVLSFAMVKQPRNLALCLNIEPLLTSEDQGSFRVSFNSFLLYVIRDE